MKQEQQAEQERSERTRERWYKEVQETEEITRHSKNCTQRQRVSWSDNNKKKSLHTRYKLGRLKWIGLGTVRTLGERGVGAKRTEEKLSSDREAVVVICGWRTHPCLLPKLLCH